LSKAQAESFFKLSKTLPDGAGHEYDVLPCTIKGRLRAEGREWEFEINAGARSTWRDKDDIRKFGCADKACEPLVLSMPLGK
jgi:hypothetical protein